ncbi:hypothetical protein EMIT0180MI3_21046 [Priestia megaterium]
MTYKANPEPSLPQLDIQNASFIYWNMMILLFFVSLPLKHLGICQR